MSEPKAEAETVEGVEGSIRRRLLDLPFEVLCLDHGAPITVDPRAALRRLLGNDSPIAPHVP